MKTFTLLKESVAPVEVKKTEVQNILSQLSVQANVDLTDKEVEIVGLDEAEISLQEHLKAEKEKSVKETIVKIEEALKAGQSWNLIVEKILNENE